MQKVSKMLQSKRAKFIALGIALAGTALAVSPHFAKINSMLKGLKQANVDCSEYENSQDPQMQQKAQECRKCKQAVDQQKGQVPGKVQSAAGKDQALESKALASSQASTAGQSNERATMGSDQGNKAGGKEAKQGQATNFAQLAKELDSCAEKISNACQGEMKQKGEEAENACKSAAQEAKQASAESAGQAEQMGNQEKKNDQNGQNMSPPQMPQMPQQQDKPSQVASNTNTGTNTSTATAVGPSGLGGNQLAGSRVAIGGGAEKSTDTATSTGGYGGRNYSASGISSGNDGKFGGRGSALGAGGGTGSGNSSGSSSLGGGMGGGDGGAGGGSAKGDAAAAAPSKPEDIEAFSNGGARPSFLGVKSHGNELADLGLDGNSGGNGSSGADQNAEAGDRSLASGEQGASGIHGEDEGGSSLFNMVHSRITEIGRRGSI